MTTIWPHLVESRCHFSTFHLYLIPILLLLLKFGWNFLTNIEISSHINLPNMDNLIRWHGIMLPKFVPPSTLKDWPNPEALADFEWKKSKEKGGDKRQSVHLIWS